MTDNELIAVANALVGEFVPSKNVSAGDVAAALITDSGHVYTGICVDTGCSMGFCAEHAAIAEMLKARESIIRTIVAVLAGSRVIAPCGRCRELIWQVNPENAGTRVLMGNGKIVTLADLLPNR